MDEKIEKYILDIVFATREPQKYKLNELSGLIQYGASPRATICLMLASKAYAFIQAGGMLPRKMSNPSARTCCGTGDRQLRGRAEEKTSDDIIKKIFNDIEVP
jgi:MoxR-like ATPase